MSEFSQTVPELAVRARNDFSISLPTDFPFSAGGRHVERRTPGRRDECEGELVMYLPCE